jgi:Flp pilus assembly protein TadD
MKEKIRSHILPLAVLGITAFAVYAAARGNAFLINYDDSYYVVSNEAIRGFSWRHLKDAFTRFYVGNYAPLHILSYMADYTLWGLRPSGFLFTNVLCHVLNGFLLYFLIVRMNGRKVWGFLAAFIFLLHPVQVESVAWISQRKNLLAMFFFLTAIHTYHSYRRQDAGRRMLFYVFSVSAFVLSLLAKSVAVILPVVLILYDLCFVSREERRYWIADKIPYVLAAGAIAVVAIISQSQEFGGGRIPYHGGSPLYTALTMPTVFVRYFMLLLWPVHLSILYLPPLKTGIDTAVLFSVLALVISGIIGWRLFRRSRELVFWFSLFFIGFLPVSQVVPLVTLMNDRYLYFPMLGAAAFCTAAALAFIDRLNGFRRTAAIAVLCLPLVILPVLSWKRIPVWQNDLTLWSDTVTKVPDLEDAWYNLGKSYQDARLMDDALAAYSKALLINPAAKDVLNNIGGIYLEQGDLQKARSYLLEAVTLDPEYYEGQLNLGISYYRLGDLGNAERTLRKAQALEPRSAQARSLLGDVYLSLRRYDLADAQYRAASELGGGNADLLFKRASLAALRGNPPEALQLLEAALKMGYRDWEQITTNRGLDPLRKLPAFRDLLLAYFGAVRNDR